MLRKGTLLGLFTETPLHPGTGSTTGVVDLPVQRERHTGFPIIHASGLKGAMREAAEQAMPDDPVVPAIFGPETSDHAGAMAVTDARLLAFPVRSLSRVYIWVTCPAAINRLKRDASILKMDTLIPETADPGQGRAYVKKESKFGKRILLEELDFSVDDTGSDTVGQCIEAILSLMPNTVLNDPHAKAREKMKKDLVIISDDDFTFLVKNATQISARIKLKKNKTNDNLWYEETIPPDSLFYTLLFFAGSRGTEIKKLDDLLESLKKGVKEYLQIGGNETVGQGWCALKYYGGC